jgi:L-seryl-tRNA(Ser) seleniumtransferase
MRGLTLTDHTTNYKFVGSRAAPTIGALAALARRAGIPLVVDWGSGDLVDLAPLGVRDEIPVARILAAGADLVTFSGDKLLGGPQAGFVVGRDDLVARLRRDPLARAVRIDRLLIAALHETLAAYARGRAFEEVPVLRMIAAAPAEIERRAQRVRREVARRTGLPARMSLIDGVSRTGGGSSPTGERPTRLLCIEPGPAGAAGLERALRRGEPPVIARVQDERVLLDLRTVLPEQEEALVDRLASALQPATAS